MTKMYTIPLAVLLVLVTIAVNSIYILEQTQYALVMQFGEAIRQEKEPGMKFKILSSTM